MPCSISGRSIESSEEAVLFPPFTGNEADPLFIFSDAVVHKDVFEKHPLATRLQDRLEAARRQAEPGNLRCRICAELITHPDSYFGLGYLVDDPRHPLYQFNYAHFHRAHLAAWSQRSALISELDELNRSGAWRGEGPSRLLAMIRSL
jgi:hypothetical protein